MMTPVQILLTSEGGDEMRNESEIIHSEIDIPMIQSAGYVIAEDNLPSEDTEEVFAGLDRNWD